MTVHKVRIKGDGTTELLVTCERCGRKKLGVNVEKRLFHCWTCGHSGRLDGEVTVRRPKVVRPAEWGAVFSDLPEHARAETRRRGFDPLWIEREFGVQWDGSRMAWPTGPSMWSRRAVEPWVVPKCLTVGRKGLTGLSRLHRGAHVVVTEGDWKSAAVPRPWVGVGTLGVGLTSWQAQTLLGTEPGNVLVLLDSGWEREAKEMALVLGGEVVSMAAWPHGTGPDDIPRRDLYALLSGAGKDGGR